MEELRCPWCDESMITEISREIYTASEDSTLQQVDTLVICSKCGDIISVDMALVPIDEEERIWLSSLRQSEG